MEACGQQHAGLLIEVADTPAFNISCPTAVRFGLGRATEVATLLPDTPVHVVFVQGASGRAAAPVLAAVRSAGHDVTIVSCLNEPSIDSINAALSGLTDASHVIACGGGAVLDMGKALAALLEMGLTLPDDFAALPPLVERTKVSLIAMPTTAGTGAEVTANVVIDVPAKRAKISIRGPGLIPDVAIIDPALAQSAPPLVALQSGLDAVTQVIESYTSNAATPFSRALCQPAIGLGLRALRSIIEDNNISAWQNMCWVSLSSGLALANSGLGAAHGLASVLGGQLGAPHGALCGRLLIPTLRMNHQRSVSEQIVHDRITECLTDICAVFPPSRPSDLLSGFEDWTEAHALPRLSDFGMRADQISGLAARGQSASSSQKNAVVLDVADYVTILQDAY